MLQQMINGSLRRVTLPVISPFASSSIRCGRSAISHAATKRLITIRVWSFSIIRIIMRVRQMQNFKRRRTLLGQLQLMSIRLWYWRHFNLPLMIWIINVSASIANDEATNFICSQIHALQDVNHFTLKTKFILIDALIKLWQNNLLQTAD